MPYARSWDSLLVICFYLAAWRAAQALMDADHCGHDLKGSARRLVYGTAALFYAGFASVAASILLGWDSSGNSEHVGCASH
jgi:hypothetical protein